MDDGPPKLPMVISAMFAGAALGSAVLGTSYITSEQDDITVDLTDQQEEEIEKIFEEMNAKKQHKTRFEMMKGFALLNPDDPSYEIEVEEIRANIHGISPIFNCV